MASRPAKPAFGRDPRRREGGQSGFAGIARTATTYAASRTIEIAIPDPPSGSPDHQCDDRDRRDEQRCVEQEVGRVAQAAGDELRILRSEIEYDDGLMTYRRIPGNGC